MNVKLEKVDLWLRRKKLSLNIDKTNYLIFTTSPQICTHIEIRNNSLVKVTQLNFLGIMIESRLCFQSHTNNLCKSVSSVIYAINIVFFSISKPITKT